MRPLHTLCLNSTSASNRVSFGKRARWVLEHGSMGVYAESDYQVVLPFQDGVDEGLVSLPSSVRSVLRGHGRQAPPHASSPTGSDEGIQIG